MQPNVARSITEGSRFVRRWCGEISSLAVDVPVEEGKELCQSTRIRR